MTRRRSCRACRRSGAEMPDAIFSGGAFRGPPDAERDGLYADLQAAHGPAADPQDGETFEHYVLRMQVEGRLYVVDPDVPVAERLTQYRAMEAARAAGAV